MSANIFSPELIDWMTRASLVAQELSDALGPDTTASVVATFPLDVSGAVAGLGADGTSAEVSISVPVEIAVHPGGAFDIDTDAVERAVKAELDALREAAR